jgi:hypothetical protein
MALDQLFGCKIDQIVQHSPTQSDLTDCDQMVVKERQIEGLPAPRFPILSLGFLMVLSARFTASKQTDIEYLSFFRFDNDNYQILTLV